VILTFTTATRLGGGGALGFGVTDYGVPCKNYLLSLSLYLPVLMPVQLACGILYIIHDDGLE